MSRRRWPLIFMSTVSTTIKDIYRNSLKGNANWYNVRVVFYLKIAELIDLKIDKDNKGGYKTAYVTMTMCLYQIIIEKSDKGMFITRLNLQVI